MEKENTHGPQHFDLNTGAKIPSIGLGTWKASPGVVGDAVVAAVKVAFSAFCVLISWFLTMKHGYGHDTNTDTPTLIII